MRKTTLSVALACTLAAGLGACAQQPQQQQPQQGEQQDQQQQSQQSQPAQGQAQDAQAATAREGFSVREISDDLIARIVENHANGSVCDRHVSVRTQRHLGQFQLTGIDIIMGLNRVVVIRPVHSHPILTPAPTAG